jgi:hypothetical protein
MGMITLSAVARALMVIMPRDGILDIFSRKVIAYRVSKKNSTQLIIFTFRKSSDERKPGPGLIFHNDRGDSIYFICIWETAAGTASSSIFLSLRKAA